MKNIIKRFKDYLDHTETIDMSDPRKIEVYTILNHFQLLTDWSNESEVVGDIFSILPQDSKSNSANSKLLYPSLRVSFIFELDSDLDLLLNWATKAAKIYSENIPYSAFIYTRDYIEYECFGNFDASPI